MLEPSCCPTPGTSGSTPPSTMPATPACQGYVKLVNDRRHLLST